MKLFLGMHRTLHDFLCCEVGWIDIIFSEEGTGA